MGVFAETGATTALFLAALGLTIGFLLLRSSRHFHRRMETQSERYRIQPEPRPRKGHHLGAPEDMVQWEVQMHEVARELSAQLDTKMGLLQQLTREADRAAARLEAALAAAEPANRQQPDAEPPVPQAVSGCEPPDWSGRVISQAEALKSAEVSARASLPEKQAETDTSATTQGRPPPELRYQEIYTLADYGFDAAEISRRIGTPVGEVELILGLRGKR